MWRRLWIAWACIVALAFAAGTPSAASDAQAKPHQGTSEFSPALNVCANALVTLQVHTGKGCLPTTETLDVPDAARGAAKAAEGLTVTFGRNANQIHHAFRHTDKLGLSRTAVQEAVQKHLPSVVDKIPAGKPLNQIIEVGGQRIQYSAFRLSDGSINVGRIHGVP